MFSSKPTDSGVCHTFNGLGLAKILRQSAWTDAFLEAFGSRDSGQLFSSEGIDLQDGFVFSLDTLQSYLVSLQEKVPEQREVNSFLIKVHPAGEIPRMTKDKSTWNRIYPHKNEMSTRFITLKGEKIVGKVDIILNEL